MRGKIMLLCAAVCMCGCACGCESLGKKFVRKPKNPKPHEVLLEPQEYPDQRPARELYDQYFLFWKSWHDEFVAALTGSSRKRQEDTAEQALKNLAEMRKCLDDQTKPKLDEYIRLMERLKDYLAADTYGAHARAHSEEADRIRRLILNDFSPGRVKEHLL